MADNTQVSAGSGDKIRDIDRGAAKTQVVQLDAGGQSAESLVTASNPLPVTLGSATVPVSASSLPLPAGAATAAGQAAIIAAVQAGPTGGGSSTVSVSNFPATQPISAAALPLPAGAATAAGVTAAAAAIVTALGTPAQAGATQAISASALPLPTGAATAANQASEIAALAQLHADLTGTVNVQQVATGFTISTLNSTTAQLAAAATFVGSVESIVNQQAISVDLVTDQPGKLTLKQYIDGAGAAIVASWPFAIAAGVPFARSWPANGNYFSLTFTNNGSAATTALNISAAFGTLPGSNSLGNLPVSVADVGGVAVPAGAMPTTIVGTPGGDFDGVALIESLMDPATGQSMQVNVANWPKRDGQGALVESDAQAPIALNGGVGATFIIDTTGYDSLSVTSLGMAANVAASDDLSGAWVALSGINRAIASAYVTAVAANGGYSFPVLTRYIKVTVTTAGAATAYLRSAPWVPGYITPPAQNVSQLNGSAPVTAGVAGTLAVGGNIAVGVAPTLQPMPVGAVDAAGLTRRILTDTAGASQVGGIDIGGTTHRLLTDASGAQIVAMTGSVPGQRSVPELLQEQVILLRVIAQYLYDMPQMIAAASIGMPGNNPRTPDQEPDNLAGELMNSSTLLTNLPN